jgi:abhydrolase domain-containing protein 17
MKPLRRLLLVLLAAYAALALYAFMIAERIIFQPPPASYQDSAAVLKLESAGGARISAVHLPHPEAAFTILFSHGNAEDLGHNAFFFEAMHQAGFAVFAYDYQGYGTSEGAPSERNLYADGDAAFRYLAGELGVAPERILVLGRSLGGAAAVDLAARYPVGGLILESSFTSAFRVLTRIPLLPFDRFRNLQKLAQVRAPVLVMHGRRDRVVGFHHGEALYAGARGPKRFLWVDDGDHNDLMLAAGAEYFDALRQFAALVRQTQAGTYVVSIPE